MSTDRAWKIFGAIDPYFGVMSHPRNRATVLTDQTKEEIFHSGAVHVQRVMATLRKINPRFSPANALDFGCGVGRVALPLASEVGTVLGVDVSPGMLEEARKNAAARGISNVRFADELLGTFDFIHSFAVIHQIPPRRGLRIVRDLVSRLDPAGMIVLQVPYAWHATQWRKLAVRLKRVDPVTMRAVNLVRGRPLSYPPMSTFSYDLRSVVRIFREAEIDEIIMILDSAAGPFHSNAMLYGQRAQ